MPATKNQTPDSLFHPHSVLDIEREEEGKPPLEFTHEDGTKHSGRMNYTAYDLRTIDVLVKQEELQAIRGIVADQKAYLKVQKIHQTLNITF